MEEHEGVELAHFNSTHTLSGVEIHETVNEDNEIYTTLSIILNDAVYTFIEDPQDGKRSRLGEVILDEVLTLSDTFEEQSVSGEFIDDGSYEYGIKFHNMRTGEIIIHVGTIDIEDTYPSFICDYFPENLDIHANIGDEDWDG